MINCPDCRARVREEKTGTAKRTNIEKALDDSAKILALKALLMDLKASHQCPVPKAPVSPTWFCCPLGRRIEEGIAL